MLKKYMVKVNGKTYEVEVEEIGEANIPSNASSQSSPKVEQIKQQPQKETQLPKIVQPASEVEKDEEIVRAPMSGTIVKIKAKVGENVKDGQTLLTLEAMKMENEILAPRDCKITEILAKEGQQVDIDQPLMKIE